MLGVGLAVIMIMNCQCHWLPAAGALLEVAVTTNAKLKIGLEALCQGGLNILVPRDLHSERQLDSLQTGDCMRVEVLRVQCRPRCRGLGMTCTAKCSLPRCDG